MHLSLQQKEQFFHEMRELLRSGKTVRETLEILAGSRSRPLREVASAMRSGGTSAAESFFAAVSGSFTDLDREVVRGGEASGHLDEAMGYLSDYYGALARTRRRIITNALYPLFILHFGAVVLAAPALVSGGVESFCMQVAVFLGVFYFLFVLAWLAFRAVMNAARSNPVADRMLQSLPALGYTRIALIGSRFCMLMGILVRASGSIFSAMSRSANASGSALFRHGADEVIAAVQGGASLGSAVARTRAFPEAIDRAFQVGEISGRLDEEMERQAARFTEQLNARLDLISHALPKLFFLVIAVVFAWKIIGFYFARFEMLNSLSF